MSQYIYLIIQYSHCPPSLWTSFKSNKIIQIWMMLVSLSNLHFLPTVGSKTGYMFSIFLKNNHNFFIFFDRILILWENKLYRYSFNLKHISGCGKNHCMNYASLKNTYYVPSFGAWFQKKLKFQKNHENLYILKINLWIINL